jgi:hypothetical protein
MARAGVIPARAPARSVTFVVLLAWFAAACASGVAGAFHQTVPVFLLAFVAVPFAGFVTAYWLSASFRAFADRIPLTFQVGAHLWRFVGLAFIIAWRRGSLPGGFAIPAGVGDIITAAGALALVPMIRGGTASRGWLLAWNTFGLIDLLAALALGILYFGGPLGLLSPGTATTSWMVTFPVSLIPTFFVPLFILFHLLTFRSIARRSRTGVF